MLLPSPPPAPYVDDALRLSADARFLLSSARLAISSAGTSAPHPNSACIIVSSSSSSSSLSSSSPFVAVADAFVSAEGSSCAEVQACERARELARGATAYLNLEPGHCHGDSANPAVSALVQAGVSRVVVGLRHPLEHFRDKAIYELRNANMKVDILGEDLKDGAGLMEALKACKEVNAPLLYTSAFRLPMSTLKYAMTLDGKIAASTGHAEWISSKMSRQRVLGIRAGSNAIIVGGNTVKRDNPRLTTRQDYGHSPIRIVMSRGMDLPEDANLWDVSHTHTIVMTQRGARKDFQKRLGRKGVEIVELDFLSPKAVADYCYDLGFLSVLWECGGALAAPAITSGVIHKVISFVAPKIIGGVRAPSPIGELGMVEMTQALDVIDVSFEQIGPDMLISGYLQPIPDLSLPTIKHTNKGSTRMSGVVKERASIISFNKTWDAYGVFSNFSPHSIIMIASNGKPMQWKTVEHYYQAQKFEGVCDPVALECIEKIRLVDAPEEAARLGRTLQKQRPDLVRPDWDLVNVELMCEALRSKFTSHPSLKSLLLSTIGSTLVEMSPSDLFWGAGREGEGLNYLGRILMKLREELLSPNTTHSVECDKVLPYNNL